MFLFLIVLLALHATAQENNAAYSMQKRAEQRAIKRFTLKEWMENKDRRALMDLWLSINSPSPYEFALSGSYIQYTLDSGTLKTAKKSMDGSFDAYATLIGITGQYQNNIEESFNDVTGMLNVRIFGNSLQGTHLTLHYGLRTRTDSNGAYRLNQNFPAVTLQLYMTKYFGVQGHYRIYMPVSETFYGDTKGDELNAGVFIDFGPVRIFGDWYEERQSSELNGVNSSLKRTGTKGGLKIFF
ncbi:MAG: hypothetical protein A2622_12945 [Bdellovibrionales bacterium RIFCSPHIGHO2_01_FULL_40_29]|nr:MAG: hypothetical protein A2622_12945 [Bdellovibrionales bacterium RIFCSPHIGHO2_01_FULL_40_29]OFZ33399.1 MAG: hypothetical protein A3D17_13940 [Bdellovibrionales bacterium RIFCSPHIGHO2_02_FULL_40_15]